MVTMLDSSAARPELDGRTFEAFRELIYAQSGIRLSDAKATLVRARIAKRMRVLELADYRSYLERVQRDGAEGELVHLLDAISTNVTSFYREPAHFEVLTQHVERLLGAGRQRLRIWSAACSTGEEPYTIALTLAGLLPGGTDARILATDLNTQVLAACGKGVFTEKSLETVPGHLRQRWFTRTGETGPKGALWRAAPELTRLLTVKRLNLSRPPFPLRGPLDAVFCRNVMIYFDHAVRRALLAEISRLLPRGGLLFVGHAESLTGMQCGLRCLQPSVYVKD